ncbi:unnamed protein product [Boreogadus saida]
MQTNFLIDEKTTQSEHCALAAGEGAAGRVHTGTSPLHGLTTDPRACLTLGRGSGDGGGTWRRVMCVGGEREGRRSRWGGGEGVEAAEGGREERRGGREDGRDEKGRRRKGKEEVEVKGIGEEEVGVPRCHGDRETRCKGYKETRRKWVMEKRIQGDKEGDEKY